VRDADSYTLLTDDSMMTINRLPYKIVSYDEKEV